MQDFTLQTLHRRKLGSALFLTSIAPADSHGTLQPPHPGLSPGELGVGSGVECFPKAERILPWQVWREWENVGGRSKRQRVGRLPQASGDHHFSSLSILSCTRTTCSQPRQCLKAPHQSVSPSLFLTMVWLCLVSGQEQLLLSD